MTQHRVVQRKDRAGSTGGPRAPGRGTSGAVEVQSDAHDAPQKGRMYRDGPPSHRRAMLEVVAAAVLFGTTGTARAKGPVGIDPVIAGFMRLAIGGPLLVILRLRSLREADPSEHAVSRLRALPGRWVLVGAACVATYQLGFFAGLARTGVSVGTVVAIGSGPILASVLAFAFLRERPTRRWLAATSLAIIGVALISLAADEGSVRALGIALVLVAGLGYAGFTVLTRELVVHGIDGPLLLGVLFSVGGLIVLPFCIGRPFGWIAEPRGLAVVLWLGIGPTAVAYTLFADGLRTLTGPIATTFVLAEPVTAVLLGRVVLSERLGSAQWFGAALVLAALIALAARRERMSPTRLAPNDQ